MAAFNIRADWFGWAAGVAKGIFNSVMPSVTGATLVVAFDDDLTANSPTATQFTVLVNAAGRTVNAAVAAGRTVTLTLASAVTTGQTVTVAYSAAGAVKVLDKWGKAAPAFTAQTVTNLT